MNKDYYAVIMAGGIGSRFWPVSTTEFPKQFHDMLGTGASLLQQTFSRLNPIVPAENIQILTNQRYLDLVLEQLPQIKESQVVLEPAMRNTAPCILLSAMRIHKENPNAIMIVAPSDHWIEDEEAFLKDVAICIEECAADKLITLGIPPSFPNTGFGYIESDKNDASLVKKVTQYREKPDYETAKAFVAAGNFLWNTGIFLWSVKSILASFEKGMPDLFALLSEGIPSYNTENEKQFIEENYKKAENISIDFGLLEKAENVYIKKATFDWNDLGTWGALHDKIGTHKQDNAVVRAMTHLENAKGNMIYTSSEKLVVIDGIDDYIIVDKEDVLVIYPRAKEQEIKQLLGKVKEGFGEKYT